MSDNDLKPSQYAAPSSETGANSQSVGDDFSEAITEAQQKNRKLPDYGTKPDAAPPGDNMDFIDHVVDGAEEIVHIGKDTLIGMYDLGTGAAQLNADLSFRGVALDLARNHTDFEIPQYLPSGRRGIETAISTGETAATVAAAVVSNPRILIAEYEDMLNKHLYGAFLGAVIVEVADLFFGSHGSTKAGKVMRLVSKLEDPAEFAKLTGDLSEVKRLLKAYPDEAQETLDELVRTLDAIDPDKLSYGAFKSWEHLKHQLSGAIDDISNELPSHVIRATEPQAGGKLLKFGDGSEVPRILNREETVRHTGDYTYERNPDFSDPTRRNEVTRYISGAINTVVDDLMTALTAKNFPNINQWLDDTREIRNNLDRLLEGCRSHHFPRGMFRDEMSVKVQRADIDYSKLSETEKAFQLGKNLQSMKEVSGHINTFLKDIIPDLKLSPGLDSFLEDLQHGLVSIEESMQKKLLALQKSE